MATTEIEHMHQDLEELKQDVSVIKHILSEEGRLTEHAKKIIGRSTSCAGLGIYQPRRIKKETSQINSELAATGQSSMLILKTEN